MSIDVHKVFAVLHKALIDAENNTTVLHLFGELSAEEIVVAHNVLKNYDDILFDRWQKLGCPDANTWRP